MALQLWSIQLKPLKNQVRAQEDRLLCHHRMKVEPCYEFLGFSTTVLKNFQEKRSFLFWKQSTTSLESGTADHKLKLVLVFRIFFMIKEEMYSSKIKEEMYSSSSQENKTAKQTTHTQRLLQVFSNFIAVIHACLSYIQEKHSRKEIPRRKPRLKASHWEVAIKLWNPTKISTETKRRLIQTKDISPFLYFSLHACWRPTNHYSILLIWGFQKSLKNSTDILFLDKPKALLVPEGF